MIMRPSAKRHLILCVVMPSADYHYTEGFYAECHLCMMKVYIRSDSHYSGCCYAVWFVLNSDVFIDMLTVMLRVVMLSAVLLCVIYALCHMFHWHSDCHYA